MRCGKGDTTGARCRRGEKEGCARGNTLSGRTSGDALRGARKGGCIEGDAGKREESAQRMKKKRKKRKKTYEQTAASHLAFMSGKAQCAQEGGGPQGRRAEERRGDPCSRL